MYLQDIDYKLQSQLENMYQSHMHLCIDHQLQCHIDQQHMVSMTLHLQLNTFLLHMKYSLKHQLLSRFQLNNLSKQIPIMKIYQLHMEYNQYLMFFPQLTRYLQGS